MGGLTASQRRLVVAVSAAAAGLLTLTASYNYMLPDMLSSLNASGSQTDMARQISTIAALLVIFAAGSLGIKLGARRVMLWCTVLFSLGSALIAVAPVMQVATLGLLLSGVGRSAVMVVAVAALSAGISDRDGRAAAFSTISAVMPVTYLVMPLVAGVLLAEANWRWVAGVWAVSGAFSWFVVWRWVRGGPAAPDPEAAGELVTPILAGVVLAVAVQVLTITPDTGVTGRIVGTVAVGVVAAVVLVIAMRRMEEPSLSIAPLRHGGLSLLLVVLVLTLFANLWFYMTMALQYIFGLSALEVAVWMAPVQLFSMAGAALAGRLVQIWGLLRTGTLLLAVVAVMLAISALIGLSTPVWVCVAILGVYSAAAIGSGVVLTNSIMDLAPRGEEGSASAFRGAANNLGNALGVAIMTGIVFSAAAASLHDQFAAAGLDPATANDVAAAMRDGATSEEASSLYAVPVAEADEINGMQQVAYVEGLHAQGVSGAAVTAVAAALFFLVRRREERKGWVASASSAA